MHTPNSYRQQTILQRKGANHFQTTSIWQWIMIQVTIEMCRYLLIPNASNLFILSFSWTFFVHKSKYGSLKMFSLMLFMLLNCWNRCVTLINKSEFNDMPFDEYDGAGIECVKILQCGICMIAKAQSWACKWNQISAIIQDCAQLVTGGCKEWH